MAIVLRSAEALEQVREQVVQGWRQGIDDRSALTDQWNRCLMAYLCQFDKKWAQYAKQANRSARFLALSWDAIETMLPQVFDVIFTNEDAQKIRPIRPGGNTEEDDLYAEQMRHLLRYQMRMGKMPAVARQGIKSLLLLGNCPWTVSWFEKKAPNYERFNDKMNEWLDKTAEYNAEYEQVMREYGQLQVQHAMAGSQPPPPPGFEPPPQPPKDLDTVYAGPRLHIGSIFNYVQEQHPNDEDSALRIMRSFRTLAYLKKLNEPDPDTGERLYENLRQVQEVVSEDTAQDNENESLIKSAFGLSMPSGKPKVELKEMHGTFEINSGDNKGIYENWICTVANDKTVIRCEPSPLASSKPMINNARLIIPFDGSVYGVGIIEKALSEQDTANAVHNQTVDATNSVIQPELEVVFDNLVDGIMKPSGPGVRHHVTEQGSIRAIEKNYSGIPLGMQQVQAAISRFERITGAINTASGVDETATRTDRNTNVVATKIGGHVFSCEDTLITPALDMFLELDAMNIEDEQVIAVTQQDKTKIVRIPPHMIRRGWYVYSAGSKFLADKETRIQNLLMAKQMASQQEASGQPSAIKMEKLDLLLFREILGDQADDLVMTTEEYQKLLADFMARKQELAVAQTMTSGTGGPESGTPGNSAGSGAA